jgi:cellulose synthase/poly-beta-1,6-N-acetylglucosamine synthase-like glycosyltransferase
LSFLAVCLVAFLFAFDFQNVLAWRRVRVLDLAPIPTDDFTVVIPLYGDPRYFAERERLLHLKERILVAIDVGEAAMRLFAGELEEEGWRVFRTRVAVPGPPTLLQAAVESDRIDTTYVIRLDADTYVGDDLPRAVAAADADAADLASVKVLVHNREGVIGRLQALEYEMAMLSRHFRPWLTSGACFVARTSAAREIFRRHSMWFPGEDLETGRIAHALRMRVRHLDVRVHTDAPATWRALFRQRRLWWAGNFRHTITNFDRNAFHTPVWTFYYIALVWCGIYFKWWTAAWAAAHLHYGLRYLPFLLGVYVLVTLVGNWQVRSRWMVLFPVYALAQAMLMPSVGSVYYAIVAWRKRDVGRYRFGLLRRRLAIGGELSGRA